MLNHGYHFILFLRARWCVEVIYDWVDGTRYYVLWQGNGLIAWVESCEGGDALRAGMRVCVREIACVHSFVCCNTVEHHILAVINLKTKTHPRGGG